MAVATLKSLLYKQATQQEWNKKQKAWGDKQLVQILTWALNSSQEINPDFLSQFGVIDQRILTLDSLGAISKEKELCCLTRMATATAAEISLRWSMCKEIKQHFSSPALSPRAEVVEIALTWQTVYRRWHSQRFLKPCKRIITIN